MNIAMRDHVLDATSSLAHTQLDVTFREHLRRIGRFRRRAERTPCTAISARTTTSNWPFCGDASQASIATCAGCATSLDWYPVCVWLVQIPLLIDARCPDLSFLLADAHSEADYLQRQLNQHMLRSLQQPSRLDSLHGIALKLVLSLRCPSTNSCIEPLKCGTTNQDPMLQHVRPSRPCEAIQRVLSNSYGQHGKRFMHTNTPSLAQWKKQKLESQTRSRKETRWT